MLIIAEVALTLLLLSAAALVLKSFARTTSLQLGFEPRGLVSAQLSDLPSPTYDDAEKLMTFTDQLVQKLSLVPGVEKAAVAANPPLLTGWQTSFLPEGMPEPTRGESFSTEVVVVSGDYFGTIGTPLLRGRTFSPNDTKDAPPVVMIDQSIVDRFFPNQDPIGKRIRVADNVWRTIIGVVPRLKVYGFNDAVPLPQSYLPTTQAQQTNLTILVRSSLPAQALERPLRQIVASLDPAQPVFDVRTMQDRVEETWAAPRLMTFLLARLRCSRLFSRLSVFTASWLTTASAGCARSVCDSRSAHGVGRSSR